MRAGAVVMLVVAVLLGGLSAFAARHWIEREVSARPVAAVAATTSVVIASAPLNFGDQIQSKHLSVVSWPASNVPVGVFSDVEEVLEGGRPRVALQRIEPNEAILKSKVSGFGGRATLSASVDENHRAVTIRVDDVSGVAGFLLPGDRVDVIMTREVGKGRPVNNVLLQDVRILGVGQISSEARDKPVVVRAVTVEATPVDSQKLILAQQVGRLSLVLRPVSDRAIGRTRSVSVSDLTADQRGPTRVAAKTSGKKRVVRRPRSDGLASIRIIRGLAISPGKVPRETPPASPGVAPTKTSADSPSAETGDSSIEPIDLMPSTLKRVNGAATESVAIP